jgi:phospholipid/cholesterol/gamma-HCH transport system substrate-binding protein
MREEIKRNLRVGAVSLVALAVLAFTILTIGNRQQIFIRHTRYHTTFANVTGLQAGSAVKLNGVDVGFVERIELPTDPNEQRIRVRFTVNVAYTERIREDTTVSVKTIGVLGDRYLEIRGGSPESPRTLEGGTIRGQDPAELAQFVSSGEDLMANLLAISSSLRSILGRVEAGEGLLGELTSTPAGEEKFSDTVKSTVATLREILHHIETGEGFLGRLLTDDAMADDLYATAHSLRLTGAAFSRDLTRDDSAFAALFRDPEMARTVREAIVATRDATEAMAAAFGELAKGEGTLPRLMQDKEYADDFLDDLQELMAHLRSIARKVDEGEGAVGAFINDPQLYQDLENVVRGVKNSKLTSWYVRNRRKSGERIEEEQAEQPEIEEHDPLAAETGGGHR